MLQSNLGAEPAGLELPNGRSLWGDALFFRAENEREAEKLLCRQLDERPYAATGTDEAGDLTFLQPGEWVFAPFKEALIAAVTRWDRIGIRTRWYDWRSDLGATPSYRDFVRDYQERDERYRAHRLSMFEALDHETYTPESFTGYWLIEDLPDGMSMLDWFGLKYRHCIKRHATVQEAKCIMQEATFDYWHLAPPKGLRLLEARRGEWR